MNNQNRGNASLLDGVRQSLANGAQAPTEVPSNDKQARKPSDYWLNIGITVQVPAKDEHGQVIVDGQGETVYEDKFISLPTGLALDDMKPTKVSGTNPEWIELAQTKNALLEAIQSQAAALKPGERASIPTLSIEIYRRNEPGQLPVNPGANALVTSMLTVLRGGKKD